eukprot:7535646-Pyramimonas_sp.AAC.1
MRLAGGCRVSMMMDVVPVLRLALEVFSLAVQACILASRRRADEKAGLMLPRVGCPSGVRRVRALLCPVANLATPRTLRAQLDHVD